MHKINELEILHGKCQNCLTEFKKANSQSGKLLWMDEYVFYAMQINAIHLRKMLEPQIEMAHG